MKTQMERLHIVKFLVSKISKADNGIVELRIVIAKTLEAEASFSIVSNKWVCIRPKSLRA